MTDVRCDVFRQESNPALMRGVAFSGSRILELEVGKDNHVASLTHTDSSTTDKGPDAYRCAILGMYECGWRRVGTGVIREREGEASLVVEDSFLSGPADVIYWSARCWTRQQAAEFCSTLLDKYSEIAKRIGYHVQGAVDGQHPMLEVRFAGENAQATSPWTFLPTLDLYGAGTAEGCADHKGGSLPLFVLMEAESLFPKNFALVTDTGTKVSLQRLLSCDLPVIKRNVDHALVITEVSIAANLSLPRGYWATVGGNRRAIRM